MRPTSIVWFERLYLGSLFIGLVLAVVGWEEARKTASPLYLLTVQGFTIALVLTLTLLVSRGRSNVAKWVNVALFALGTAMFAYLLAIEKLDRWLFVGIVQTVLQAVGIGLLFTSSARAWLGRPDEPQSPAELQRTFD